jgi:hypothetical protein
VTAEIGVRNIGRAFVRGDRGFAARVAVIPPAGTTVRSYPDDCFPRTAARRVFECVTRGVDPFEPDTSITWPFRLRIDRAGELTGTVAALAGQKEPRLGNNIARLVVNRASGTAGGEPEPALPITGPPVAWMTALGLLLVAAGVALRRIAR